MKSTRLQTFLLGAPLVLSACATAGPATLPDQDGDGLADDWEADNDLLPDSEDTDEDGWADGDEVFGFADGADEMDHPYIGGWERGPVPSDLEATGHDVGDVPDDFRLLDQFGEEVSLWSFYGRVILIESVAEW